MMVWRMVTRAYATWGARAIVLMAAVMAVGVGCQGITYSAEELRSLQRDVSQPKVVRETRSLFLRLRHGQEVGDLEMQLALLDKVIEAQDVVWKMTYRIVPLQDAGGEVEQGAWLERVADHLRDKGARQRDISVRSGGHPVGALLNEPLPKAQGSTILVSVDRYAVLDAACLSFFEEEKVGADISQPRFREGCIVENNRLKHAAYPQDLYEAQRLDPPLSSREGPVIERYQAPEDGGNQQGGGGGGGEGDNPFEGLFGN